VEGRLKTPEYVAAAAKNYREVIDGAPVNLEKRAEELATTYSRGFFTGWLRGVDHQKLVDGTYSAHRGLEIGVIVEIRKKTLIVSSTTALKAGMGLLFAGKEEVGSKIFLVEKSGKFYEVELLQKDLKLEKGTKVYLNSNDGLFMELQKGWSSREKQKRIPLNFLVQGLYNEPLLVKVTDPEGREVYAQTISHLAPASARPMTEAFLQDELSAFGNTVYKMGKFECFIQEGLFLNHRELKDVRREIVEKMNQVRIARTATVAPFELQTSTKHSARAGMNILLRTKAQVEGLVKNFALFQGYKELIKSVILDFEFGKDYLTSVEMIKSLGLTAGIATTRILKPSEYYNLNTIIRCNPDLILVRNLGAIEYLKSKTEIPLVGDFSLNVTNSLTLDYLVSKGLESVNVSYDLNQDQLLDMVKFSDPSKMEVTLHQYMPEFHMEHCVFAAFMSNGSSFKDCGKPCEKHEVKLKDPYGNMHFLKADQECRNTFFKATPQSAGFLAQELINKGVSNFRIEALNETAEEINLKIVTYLKLLNNEITPDLALSSLKVVESYGLGLGQMNKVDTYKDRKKI
jgi:putative protease